MKRAFAVGAHPDDIEFMMSGTLVLLGRAGYELHYMTVANGSCGTSKYDRATIVEIRREESIAAAELIGATYHEPLVDDLDIYYDKVSAARLGAVVREVAPEILLVHSPEDYMEDHANACRLAVTAAFCRCMRNFPVEPHVEPVDDPVTIYHAQPFGNRTPLRRIVRPDIFVNVSDVLDVKNDMLAAHKSQRRWLDESQGQDSYLRTMRQLARELGIWSERFEYAEGWRRHLHLGFCGPDDDPLTTALGESALTVDDGK